MGTVRARQVSAALRDPTSGVWVAPDTSAVYEANDPLVVAHRWAFVSEEDMASPAGEAPQ